MIFMTDWHGCTFCSLIIGGARLMHGPFSKILGASSLAPRIDAPAYLKLFTNKWWLQKNEVGIMLRDYAFGHTLYNIWTKWTSIRQYIVFQKEATKLLTITFSNLNQFSKFFQCWKGGIFPTKLRNISPHTLSMFLHYLGKVNSSNLLQR